LLIEDVRIKKGKSRIERVVVYPELIAGFDEEYQKAKARMTFPGGDPPAGPEAPTSLEIG
jgi:hypothetical protein